MRIAAGILLLLLGLILLVGLVVLLITTGIPALGLPLDVLEILWGAFLVAGGVLCIKRKCWKVCFASALAAVALMVFYLRGPLDTATWLDWFVIITGVLPIIFVSLRKTEWQDPAAANG